MGRCAGKTASGAPCKHSAVRGSMYCYQHQNQSQTQPPKQRQPQPYTTKPHTSRPMLHPQQQQQQQQPPPPLQRVMYVKQQQQQPVPVAQPQLQVMPQYQQPQQPPHNAANFKVIFPDAKTTERIFRYPFQLTYDCLYKLSGTEALKGYDIDKWIGAGKTSDVYTLCTGGKCDRVLKVFPIGPTTFDEWKKFIKASGITFTDFSTNVVYKRATSNATKKMAELNGMDPFKIGLVKPRPDYESYLHYKTQVYDTQMQTFHAERRNMIMAMENGIGPALYAAWTCVTPVNVNGTEVIFHYGFFAMERLQMTYYEYLAPIYQKIFGYNGDTRKQNEIIGTIKAFLNRVSDVEKRNGIINKDIHASNVYVNVDPRDATKLTKMVLGDWGISAEGLDILTDEFKAYTDPRGMYSSFDDEFLAHLQYDRAMGKPY